jgi:hypothetical protein
VNLLRGFYLPIHAESTLRRLSLPARADLEHLASLHDDGIEVVRRHTANAAVRSGIARCQNERLIARLHSAAT